MRPTVALYGISDHSAASGRPSVHDHNICVMVGGKVLHYLHVERLTRRKYDNSLPEIVDDLLSGELAYVMSQDPDVVSVDSFAGRHFASKSRRLRIDCGADNLRPGLEAVPASWQREGYGHERFRGYCLSHEIAHVTSVLPFSPPPEEGALFVHFDGGASVSNFSAFLWRSGELAPIEWHWDLGPIASIYNSSVLSFALLGIPRQAHCTLAGKLMGYASLQSPRADVVKWLEGQGYFLACQNFPSLFFREARERFGWQGGDFDTHDPFLQTVAASLQDIFVTAWKDKLADLSEIHRPSSIYLSGGCALNIVANASLLALRGLPPLYIPPCCNDAGLSIGAACMLELSKGNSISGHSPYLNSMSTDLPETTPLKQDTLGRVAELLAGGAVIGVCNGWGEAGPRALGNRSLLARADCPELARHVSQTCKEREWYRPIAPVMRMEQAKRLLVLDLPHHLGRYMLLEFQVAPSSGHCLDGVVHANGSVRAQILEVEADNPFLWRLLNVLEVQYGICALLNTSFNGPNEPMVHTAQEARDAMRRMRLDGVVINGELEV